MRTPTLSLRRVLPVLALLGSLALSSCFDKQGDPKPRTHQGGGGKCGTPPPPPAPAPGNS